MSRHRRLAALSLALSIPLVAQTPPQFRLVMPTGPGSILIDTTGGWTVDHAMLTNNGKRPVVQLHNEALGIEVSYILDHDPPYYKDSKDCLNDSLGTVMKGPLAKASIKDKSSDSRVLKDGKTLYIGSYVIEKDGGITLHQKNVWGFLADDNTCATVHLSRTAFKAGEEHLFDATLNSFRFEPAYVPTKADYAVMASLLPPAMARLYDVNLAEAADAGPPKSKAQSPDQSLTFALAEHPGYLHLDAPNFVITELSAKPNGKEFGIRADDKGFTHAEILAFLFMPDPAEATAVACREWMLKSEQKDNSGYRKVLGKREIKSASGVPIALVDYEQSKQPGPFSFIRRAFIADGDLCADLSIYAPTAYAPTAVSADANDVVLDSLIFDPSRPPDFFAKFRYATVLFDHHNLAAAAPLYESALTLVDAVPDARYWRRIATDRASVTYGMAGDLKHSRLLNEAAIAKDPDYPLYYYDLACADAESGDAASARTHLQQAFDRRSNTLPGEKLPDPAKDDSILKLKQDTTFWAFVESLPRN